MTRPRRGSQTSTLNSSRLCPRSVLIIGMKTEYRLSPVLTRLVQPVDMSTSRVLATTPAMALRITK